MNGSAPHTNQNTVLKKWNTGNVTYNKLFDNPDKKSSDPDLYFTRTSPYWVPVLESQESAKPEQVPVLKDLYW
jgi:hypothetical protein